MRGDREMIRVQRTFDAYAVRLEAAEGLLPLQATPREALALHVLLGQLAQLKPEVAGLRAAGRDLPLDTFHRHLLASMNAAGISSESVLR